MMYSKKKIGLRIISFVLAISFLMPIIPFTPWEKEVQAAEITGETHNISLSGTSANMLNTILDTMTDASENPNDLYVLTHDSSTTITISSNTTLETDGNVVIKRTSTSKGTNLFTVSSGATLNIGSEEMKGTIRVDGGATWTLDSSKSYDFDTEKPTGNGGNGTANIMTSGSSTYILFNDGDSYRDAHWYQFEGVTSTKSLIQNNGTLNVYDGVTIGNAYLRPSSSWGSSVSGGAVYNSGTFYMHGGEVSWNAVARSNDGTGAGIYCGPESKTTVFYLNGGKVSNNTAVDYSTESADGGGIAVDKGTIYINGGTICNNRAATGGSDAAADGGGIIARVGATIYMNAGSIEKNFAGGFGGGVLLWNSTLDMRGGTIANNFARNGGGVGMSTNSKSTFHMFNDATVTNNYAEYGGGVCVGANGYATNSDFTMYNGKITYNYAEHVGGGICNYNESNCSVNLRSGTISNNRVASTGKGNGVGIYNLGTGTETLLYMSGAIVVDPNNNIYIDKINTNQVPVKVEGRLSAVGTVGMLSVDSWASYANDNIVLFERSDGGSLEVQSNKIAVDTDQYILAENGKYLQLVAADTSSTAKSYVARIGDRLYTTLAGAVEALGDEGGNIYLINNVTITETININSNINIISETTTSKNASNVIDGAWKNENGSTISSTYTYHPLGDYTITLSSSFGDLSSNTAGFKINNGGVLTLGDNTVTENTLSSTVGGYVVIDGNSGYKINEALIHVAEGGKLVANYGVTISNNAVNADVDGAGVKVEGTFDLNGAIIKNNTTNKNGAGIFVDGILNFNDGEVLSNEATENGAGIFVSSTGNVTVQDGEIISNKANGTSSNGGGLYLENGANVLVNDLDILSNEANQNGAGIYVEEGATLIIKGGTTSGNKTYYGNGAGIYNKGLVTISKGTLSGNTISSYNSNPLGEAIYLDGELKVGSEIRVLEDNTIHLTEGNTIEIQEKLLYSKSIPVSLWSDANNTKIAYVNTGSVDTDINLIEEGVLSNNSIYHVGGKKIVRSAISGEENYLIIGNIKVNYNANNATSGTVPTDGTAYNGGDLVNVLPNSGTLTRNNYIFLGWSTVETTPLTTPVQEVSIPIYYEAGNNLVDGVLYQDELKIYTNLTLYAVWAVDANNNGVVDYREDMNSITILASENGGTTSNVSEGQGGTLVMLTTTQDDGYEVREIVVSYELNGVQEEMTLSEGEVVKLTESYFYFNMPNADVTITTTFAQQSQNAVRVTWLDSQNTESTEEFTSLQLAINQIDENLLDGTLRAKEVLLLKYNYTLTDINIPSGHNYEINLMGYTLDMNNRNFQVDSGATIKIVDAFNGGRITFNSTGGIEGAKPNHIENNGTLIIADGTISTEDGEKATAYTILNKGTLEITAGKVIHEAIHGTGIYNEGTLTIVGGNIAGGKYGIHHVNTTDMLNLQEATAVTHAFNISNMGSAATYGINGSNYISSIFLGENTHVNIPSVFETCTDSAVEAEEKILLVLDDSFEEKDVVLTSNKLPFLIEHLRTHFKLDQNNYELGVDEAKRCVLISKIDALKTESSTMLFEYNTPVTLKATVLDENGDAYVGAKGKVHFFAFPKTTAVSEWAKIWNEADHTFQIKEQNDGENVTYYSEQDAIGSASIDETTGIAEFTFNYPVLEKDTYVIYGLYFGEDVYSHYSELGDETYGYVGPIVASTRGEFAVTSKDIANTTITVTKSKSYTGSELMPEIEIYDGTTLLQENVDYEITGITSLTDVGTYNIRIHGIGNYTNSVTKQFEITQYEDKISVTGINRKYIYNNAVPEINFGDNVLVKDIYGAELAFNSDYKVSYYRYNSDTTNYEPITELSKDVGVYKIVINGTGSGNYSASITYEIAFIIASDASATYEVTIENNTLTYNGIERIIDELGAITVKDTSNDQILKKGTDYIVAWGVSTVKNVKEYAVVIQGIGNYSDMNLVETINVVPVVLTSDNTTITFEESQFTYTGREIIPTIKSIEIAGVNTDATKGGTPIVLGTDYVTSVKSNINVGDAILEVVALNGNYTGTIQKTFKVLPRDINSSEISVSLYQVGYSGVEVIPTITIIDQISGTKVLVKGENQDYTVLYRANADANDGALISENGYPINKGTYDVVLTGNGNYTGTRTETFVIGNYKGKIISELSPSKYTYSGNANTLHASIKDALVVTRGTDGELLELDKDYILGYNSPENTTPPSEVGEYILYIVGIGNYDGVQTTSAFSISPLTGSVYIEMLQDELTYNGKEQYPQIVLDKTYLTVKGQKVFLSNLRENIDYTISYNTASKDVGTYIVQVNGVGNYAGNYNFANYSIVSKTIDAYDVVVKSKAPISKYYNGTEQTLVISPAGDIWLEYQLADNTVIMLEEGKDFTATYSNNINAGNAVVVIVGKGNYTGIKIYNFVIETRSIGLGTIAEGFSITPLENQKYNGTAIVQDIILEDVTNNYELENGKDYTIAYQNNVNVGTAKVTINGKGNYSGVINLEFEIEIGHTISIIAEDEYNYTESKIEAVITVKDSLGFVLAESDYKIEYYTDSALTTKTSTQNSGTDTAGGAPVFVGTYYRKVTGTSNNYLGLTAVQEINVIKVSTSAGFQVDITNTTNVYDSLNKNASVIVTDGSGNLIPENEYEVVYYKDAECTLKTQLTDGATSEGAAPSNAGVYYVQAEGRETYDGIKSKAQFVITKRSLNDVNVATVASQYYTGSPIEPTPVVSFTQGGKTIVLTENVDFTYGYNNNQKAGTANIIIKALENSRNYTGSKQITFTIMEAEELVLELVNPQRTYEGKELELTDEEILVKVSDTETKTIKELKENSQSGNTYEIVMEDVLENVGEYEVSVEVRQNGVLIQNGKTTLEVLPKEIIITPKTLNKIYGEANPTYEYETNLTDSNINENGLYGDDEFVGMLSRQDGESVGTYEFSLENLSADNYKLTLDTSKVFEVKAKDIADAEMITNGIEVAYTYTGGVIKPEPMIIYPVNSVRITLLKGTDYEIVGYAKKNVETGEYENVVEPKEVGEYKITASGKGNYTGERTFYYTIDALKAFNATITNTTKEYNRDNQSATVVVTGTTGSLVENTDYKLAYYTDENYTQKTTNSDLSGARSEGGAPSEVGKYYLRVEGIGNYNGSVAKAEFRITPKNITDKDALSNYEIKISNIPDQTYTGNQITPSVTLTWNGIALDENDYNVSCINNTEVGVATLTINGTGNYTGSRLLNFNIVAITGGKVNITLTDDKGDELTDTTYTYDGTEKKPNVSITYVPTEGNEIDLEEDKDYTVKYVNPINAGNAEISILLTGNYSGNATTTYVIAPRNLSETEIKITPVSESYTGKVSYPEVNVSYLNMILTGNQDYTVDYGTKEYIDKGEYTVKISATAGNYTGSVEKTYTIKPYGTTSNEYLNLDFANDVTTYLDSNFTEALLKSNLVVKDLNGNTLGADEYDVFYSSDDGATWSATPVTTVGSYLVKIAGKADSNYDSTYAKAIRGYTIYTDHLVASDITTTYNGEIHTISNADITVTTTEGVTVSSDDYDVTFGNIEVKEAGNYTIFITGKNAYAGANGSSTYKVMPATFEVGTISEKTFDGVMENPELSVVGINDLELTQGVDYNLSYTGTTIAGSYYESTKAPVAAGTYSVRVLGRANYAGMDESVTYKINPKSLADSDIIVTLSNSKDIYNTFEQKINATAIYKVNGHSINLVEGVDYEIVGEQEFKNAGKYTIELKAKTGNYKDTTNTTYEITPYVGKLQVEMDATIFNYGTSVDTIKQNLTVEYGSEELTGDMYDVSFYPSTSSIPEIGSYTLNVVANTNNYKSDVEAAYGFVKFTIIEASEITITFANPSVKYNGKVQKPTSDDILVEGKSITDWKTDGKEYEIDYGEGTYKDAASYMITVSYYEGGILKERNVGAYTIEKAEVIITPDSNQSKIFGEKDKTLAYKTNITTGTDGLYESDVLSGSLTRVQGDNVGEYEIKQKDLFANNYDIKVTTGVRYKILPKSLSNDDIAGITITGIQSTYTYTGTAIKPRPIITYTSNLYGDSLALAENTNFKVSYKYYDESSKEYKDATSDNELINVGNYKIIITGEVNYTGTVEMEYEISSYVASFATSISNNYKTFNNKNQMAQVQVTGPDKVLIEGVDYKIVYYTDTACITPTTTSDASGAMTTGGCPKNVGTYNIQVEGLGNYGGTSRAPFVISPKNIADEDVTLGTILDQTYMGEEIKPTVKLTWDTELTANDYTVEYSDNEQIGVARVKITGKGNYTGTRETTFNIVAITGGRIEIALYENNVEVTDTTYTYDATEKKPETKVIYYSELEEKELQEDTDYEVSYTNTINAGTVQVTITLIGNYKGVATKTYTINKYNLSNATMEIIPTELVYTGKTQKPNVQVTAGNIILEESKDYTLEYVGDFVDTDNYEIKVNAVANSNYTGSLSDESFEIKAYGNKATDILHLEFKDEVSSYQEGFDQTTFENNLLVVDLNLNVLDQEEYDVTYSSDGQTWSTTFPTTVGVYYVKVTGKGNNYAGKNDTAQRAFVVYVESLVANNQTKEYKAAKYEVADILSDITLQSAEGTILPKEEFTISFGTVEPQNAGKYTVIITGKPGTDYQNIYGTSTFTIEPAKLTLESVTSVTYNGMVQIPSMEVSGVNNENVEEGKDYIIRYTGTDVNGNPYDSSIAPIKVGTYKVFVVGRGNYANSISEQDYEIENATLQAGNLRVELSNNSVIYNTSIQKPTLTVFYEMNDYILALNEGADYKVDYGTENYKDAGVYTIKVEALSTSNYSGTQTVEFEIMPYTGKLDVSLNETEFKNGVAPERILEGLKVTYINDTFTESDYTVEFVPSELTLGTGVLKVSAKNGNNNYYLDSENYAEGTTTFKIVNATEITLALENVEVTYNAKEQKPTTEDVLVRGKSVKEWAEAGIDYEVDYGEGDYKTPGVYEITVTLEDVDGTLQEKASVEYTINKKQVTITPVSNLTKIYGKKDVTFEYTTDLNTSTGLYEADTFEGSLTREQGEAVGTYKILLGTLSAENYELQFVENVLFEITPKSILGSEVVFVGGIENVYIYNQNAINPKPIFRYESEALGTLALTENVDYKVSYQKYNEEIKDFEDINATESKNVGRYAVKVTGINSYEGTTYKEYNIVAYESDFVVNVLSGTKTYNKENQEIEIEVSTSNGTKLTKDTEYEIIYYKDAELTQKTSELDGATEEGESPSKSGTYFVKILGKGNYEDSTAVSTFVITKKAINELTFSEIEPQNYNGSAIRPKPIVKHGDTALVENIDYTLSYNNNINMGTNTASVTIEAVESSNYTGSKSITFTIKMNSSEEIIATLKDYLGNDVNDSTYTYDGNAKEPAVIVTQESRTLRPGIDYDVKYEDNVEAGEATVIVTMKGSYVGEVQRTFKINPKEITKEMITISRQSVVFNAKNVKPTVEVSFTTNENMIVELKAERDYKITYPESSVNVGEYTIVIEAQGKNYIGEQEVQFEITPNTEKLSVIWNTSNLFKSTTAFNSENIKNEFILTDTYGNVLTANDYKVTFDKDPVSPGSYKMTVTATNPNYINGENAATTTEEFHISKISSGSGGGGGGSSSTETTVTPGVVGNVTKLELDKSNSMLDKINHKGYITGYSDGTFRPDRTMTRAEAVTIFVRLLKQKPNIVSETDFTDVSGHWAEESIKIMSTLKIVNGYSDGTFRPDGKITRAEFATIVSRFEEIENTTLDPYFKDISKNYWAYKTISFAYDKGWISGYEDKTFRPDNVITRAEAVTIINRVLGRTADKKYLTDSSELNTYKDIESHWAYYGILEASTSHDYDKESNKESWENLWGEEYRVIYYMNDKEGMIYKDKDTYEIDEKVNLPKKAYSESEDCFLGWSLESDGKVLKEYKVTEENIQNNAVILYAIWK